MVNLCCSAPDVHIKKMCSGEAAHMTNENRFGAINASLMGLFPL